jgi:endonuclease-3 related protein
VPKTSPSVPAILDKLEKHYGPQRPTWPTDPYEFVVWWLCGYPQSDLNCANGWAGLESSIGTSAEALLAASPSKLAAALKPGGMVPELRGQRLKEIAMRVLNEFGGDLRAALASVPISAARKLLKKFPNIADPGADRILLFARIAPIAAVPSNNVHSLVRILHGRERENYGVNYRQAKLDIESQVPENFAAFSRAYLLLKIHGQTLCKRTKPKCEECPVNRECAYAAGHRRGRAS